MIYQIQTLVIDGNQTIDKHMFYTGKEPKCWFKLAMDAYVRVVGAINEPTCLARNVDRFTTDYEIKDWFICGNCSEEHTIELMVQVTVNERLTLD